MDPKIDSEAEQSASSLGLNSISHSPKYTEQKCSPRNVNE